MARRLRKKRVVGAVIVFLLIIVIIGGIVVAFKRKGAGAPRQEQAQQTQTGAVSSNTAQWPPNLYAYISEYTGAGNIGSADETTSDKGRRVYTVTYKGTTIDSCFAYAKQIGITGEWTEVVTDEHYTIARELDKYTVNLSCEPKGQNGYDFKITVEIK